MIKLIFFRSLLVLYHETFSTKDSFVKYYQKLFELKHLKKTKMIELAQLIKERFLVNVGINEHKIASSKILSATGFKKGA